nr:outer membrane beta-barrel protein [uncultured Bacteroides sp.]
MKKDEDELTELFHSRLKKYEIPLQEDMWEDLEKELSKPSPRKLYSILFIAAAAIFLILFACSAAVWMFAPHKEASSLLSKASAPVIEKHDAIAKADKVIINNPVTEEAVEQTPVPEEKVVIEKTVEAIPADTAIQKEEPKKQSQNVLMSAEVQAAEAMAQEDDDYIKVHTEKEWSLGLSASIEPCKSFTKVGSNSEPINICYKEPVSLSLTIGKRLSDKISIESGINYTLLRSSLKDEAGGNLTDQKFHFIGIPLRVSYTLINKKDFDLYASAGGMLEECISPKSEYYSGTSQTDKDDYNMDRMQCSLTASVGFQYNTSEHLALFAEPGLAYYFDDHALASTIRKERPLNFNLRCGVKLVY